MTRSFVLSEENLQKHERYVIWRDHDGLIHRDDGPAAIRDDGLRYWYVHGVLDRRGGPSVERPDGAKQWHKDHRMELPRRPVRFSLE